MSGDAAESLEIPTSPSHKGHGGFDYKEFISETIKTSRAIQERQERKSRIPSENAIQENYLRALESFSDNPLESEILIQNDAPGPIETRFALQTTLNYLLIRDLTGLSTEEEQATLACLKQNAKDDDPEPTVLQSKKLIRERYPQDEIESFLPDSQEKIIRKDKLSILQVASLSELILQTELHKSPDQQSPVRAACKAILEKGAEADPYFETHRPTDPKIRREALTTCINQLAENGLPLDFIDAHDKLSQKPLFYLMENPGLLIQMYLNDLDQGKPVILKRGELKDKVEKILGDNPEKEFLVKYAESVEERMRSNLNRLIDSQTGEYKPQIFDYMESEEKLKNTLSNLPDTEEPEPISTPEMARPIIGPIEPIRTKLITPEEAQAHLEAKNPKVSEIVKTAIEKLGNLNPTQEYSSTILRKFGIPKEFVSRMIKGGFVDAIGIKGHDQEFTALQVIKILALYNRGLANDLDSGLTKELDIYIKDLHRKSIDQKTTSLTAVG